jgi:hypothetical protein
MLADTLKPEPTQHNSLDRLQIRKEKSKALLVMLAATLKPEPTQHNSLDRLQIRK